MNMILFHVLEANLLPENIFMDSTWNHHHKHMTLRIKLSCWINHEWLRAISLNINVLLEHSVCHTQDQQVKRSKYQAFNIFMGDTKIMKCNSHLKFSQIPKMREVKPERWGWRIDPAAHGGYPSREKPKRLRFKFFSKDSAEITSAGYGQKLSGLIVKRQEPENNCGGR